MKLAQVELLFPPHLISSLLEARGSIWQDLIRSMSQYTNTSKEQVAFVLLIARLVNCATCNANSFRASQGCSFCSKQALKRFHDSDVEVLHLYEIAKQDVEAYSCNRSTLFSLQETTSKAASQSIKGEPCQ